MTPNVIAVAVKYGYTECAQVNHSVRASLTVNIADHPTHGSIFKQTDVDQVLTFIRHRLAPLIQTPEMARVSNQKTLVLLFNDFKPYGIQPLIDAIYKRVSAAKVYDRIEFAETSVAWAHTFERRRGVDYAVIFFLAAQDFPIRGNPDKIDEYIRGYVPGMK